MQGTVDERLAAAGGVSGSLVDAFRSLLKGECLWGAQELAAASCALLPEALCNANALQAERSLLPSVGASLTPNVQETFSAIAAWHVGAAACLHCLLCLALWLRTGAGPHFALFAVIFPPSDPSLDGTFKAFAINLPGSSELLDRIPEADPVLLYQVCEVSRLSRLFGVCKMQLLEGPDFCLLGHNACCGCRSAPPQLLHVHKLAVRVPAMECMFNSVLPFALQVRDYVTKELAQQLRPELEAAVKENDSGEAGQMLLHGWTLLVAGLATLRTIARKRLLSK